MELCQDFFLFLSFFLFFLFFLHLVVSLEQWLAVPQGDDRRFLPCVLRRHLGQREGLLFGVVRDEHAVIGQVVLLEVDVFVRAFGRLKDLLAQPSGLFVVQAIPSDEAPIIVLRLSGVLLRFQIILKSLLPEFTCFLERYELEQPESFWLVGMDSQVELLFDICLPFREIDFKLRLDI